MDDTIQLQKELAKFIDMHSVSHAGRINTIDAVVLSIDQMQDLQTVMRMLGREYVSIDLSMDRSRCLASLALALTEGKTIFLQSTDLHIDPVVYDQLMQIREQNRFSVNMVEEGIDLMKVSISPAAHMFLVLETNEGQLSTDLPVLADHILDIRKEVHHE